MQSIYNRRIHRYLLSLSTWNETSRKAASQNLIRSGCDTQVGIVYQSKSTIFGRTVYTGLQNIEFWLRLSVLMRQNKNQNPECYLLKLTFRLLSSSSSSSPSSSLSSLLLLLQCMYLIIWNTCTSMYVLHNVNITYRCIALHHCCVVMYVLPHRTYLPAHNTTFCTITTTTLL